MSVYCRLILQSIGQEPLKVLSHIREWTGFTPAKGNWIETNLPMTLFEGLSEEGAGRMKAGLEEAGAEVLLEESPIRQPMMAWNQELDGLPAVISQMPYRPYSFCWLVENVIAGMGRPGTMPDIEFLHALNFSLIISLTEDPLEPIAGQVLPAQFLHLPVRDMTAPTLEQVHTAITAIEETVQNEGRVLVHCGAGLGRTGVILSCFLIHLGNSPEDSIAAVRYRRPGSIETAAQEHVIRQYAEEIGKSKTVGEDAGADNDG